MGLFEGAPNLKARYDRERLSLLRAAKLKLASIYYHGEDTKIEPQKKLIKDLRGSFSYAQKIRS